MKNLNLCMCTSVIIQTVPQQLKWLNENETEIAGKKVDWSFNLAKEDLFIHYESSIAKFSS